MRRPDLLTGSLFLFRAKGPMIPAEETGLGSKPGAEGATAPETLRPKDRAGAGTLESGDASNASPTDGRNLPLRAVGEISQVS